MRVLRGKAVVNVKLPSPDAQLWVNDQATKQSGQARVFVTPDLEPGSYRYRFQASWTADDVPVRASRTVVFQPGDDVVVDFTTEPKPVP
jgi:uncharacterized protein (TIGR03000 family)